MSPRVRRHGGRGALPSSAHCPREAEQKWLEAAECGSGGPCPAPLGLPGGWVCTLAPWPPARPHPRSPGSWLRGGGPSTRLASAQPLESADCPSLRVSFLCLALGTRIPPSPGPFDLGLSPDALSPHTDPHVGTGGTRLLPRRDLPPLWTPSRPERPTPHPVTQATRICGALTPRRHGGPGDAGGGIRVPDGVASGGVRVHLEVAPVRPSTELHGSGWPCPAGLWALCPTLWTARAPFS